MLQPRFLRAGERAPRPSERWPAARGVLEAIAVQGHQRALQSHHGRSRLIASELLTDRGSPGFFVSRLLRGRLFPRLRRIGSKNFGGIRREFTTTETTKGNQMRENLSLLSYWGLIFTLIAVTLFVVVYMYMSNTGKGEDRDMVEYLRRRSVAIYLAAASSTNEDISSKLRAAANEIERLRAQNYVLFWLIIAINAVVVSLLAIAYKSF